MFIGLVASFVLHHSNVCILLLFLLLPTANFLPFLYVLIDFSLISCVLSKEKGLPSYLMAIEYKIFDKLYELAHIEHNG